MRRLTWTILATLAATGIASEASAISLLSLNTLRAGKDVEVALDTGRFKDSRVATMKITNKRGIPLRGDIRACDTVFVPKDPRYSPLRPTESGPFVVGPGQTVTIARLFRLVDPVKRPPDGAGEYVLTDDPEPEAGCKD